MSFETHAKKPVSEKVTLVWAHASRRLITWELYSGAVYRRQELFTIHVCQCSTDLTEGSSTSLNAGEWYYEATTGYLYIRCTDDSNPSTNSIRGDIRFFFSNTAIDLPYDLSTGTIVHYEPRVMAAPQAKQAVDNTDLVGVAIENSGRVSFHNGDAFFDDIFDQYIWENKSVIVYSYSPEGYRIIFKGIVKDKSYTKTSVAFLLKDFLYQLRDNAVSNLYSSDDGRISNDIIGQNKRVIYGKTSGLRLQSITQVVDGEQMAGTISGSAGGTTITGTSTQFLAEISPSDTIEVLINNVVWEISVDSVDSDTQFTTSDDIETSFSDSDYNVRPERVYREYNRTYYVADHKLREPTTTVAAVAQLNRIELASVEDLFPDDDIKIGSEYGQIKRISGELVTLWQNLNTTPSIGATVTRSPITAVYFQHKLINRALYTVDNQDDYCKITLDEFAETEKGITKSVVGTISFTNTSRTVTISSGNFEKLRSRDWIKSNDINHNTWYEILQIVDETTLHLRTNYLGTNYSGPGKYKNIEYLGDLDIVTVDCYGKEANGSWIKTGPDAVKDLLTMAAIPNINDQSFSDANIDCPYVIDVKLPLVKSGLMSTYRDIITLINKSVLANLAVNQDFELVYNTLNASIPSDIETIASDDYLSYTVSSNTEIIKTAVCRYAHFDADYISHSSGSSAVQATSDFVTNIVQGTATKEYALHLSDYTEAKEIAERLLLFNSLTNSIIKIRGKLNFSIFNINDKVKLSLRRIYRRFGAADTDRVGVLSSITKNGKDTTIEFTDLGNSLNRSARIAPEDAPDFEDATAEEKIYYGYIVDNDTELPDDNERNWGNYIIN